MRKSMIISCAAVAIAFSAAVAHSPAGVPLEFAKYPGESRLQTNPHALVLDTKEKRRFRTILRSEAAEGANFNGHYRVASWGCGTNCIQWAIANLSTGKVWMAREPAHSCWFPDASDEAENLDWFEIYEKSSLLYLCTCRDDRHHRTFDTRSVYNWSGETLRLLRIEPISRQRLEP
jgi:hypothetical protein